MDVRSNFKSGIAYDDLRERPVLGLGGLAFHFLPPRSRE
jgi:hypothetical protein